MTKHVGKLIKVGLGKEGTRGTEASSIDYWLGSTELSHQDSPEYFNDESAVGTIYQAQASEIGMEVAEGGYEAQIGVDHFGLVALSLLGSVSTAADTPEAGVNTHTFTLSEDAQHQSLTLAVSEPNEDKAFIRAVLSSLSISYGLGQYISYTAEMFSEPATAPGSSYSPSFSQETLFRPQDVTVKIADSVSGLDGASAVSLEALDVEFDKGVDPSEDHNLGNKVPADFLNTVVATSGSLEATFDGPSNWQDFVTGDTEKAMRISIKNTGVTIGSSTNPEIVLEFNKVSFQNHDRDNSLDTLVAETVEFIPLYDLANSKFGEIRLINTEPSY